MMADGDDRIVPFPGPEPVPDEERVRRLRAEVERMARLSPGEYLLYLDEVAKRYDVDKAVLRAMVEAVVKEIEKKAAEDRGELRRREDRDEKRRDAAVRETERKADRAADRAERRDRERDRAQERRDREAAKAAEKREHEEEAKRAKREAAFAEIVDLPQLTHETRLREAATRLGEDAEVMIEEFECFRAARTIPEDLTPWPEPVNTAELLATTEAKFRRYVVANDAIVTASALWVPFSYVVEVATHATKLIYTFPLRDAGKSVALQTMRWMVLRAYPAVEITGAALYHVIDRLRPTLILEEGDTLFVRRTVLSSILNQSWTNDGSKFTRAGLSG